MTAIDVEFLESPEPSEDQPETPEAAKKIAGKSPTRIALERLRKDPVAIVCGSITGFLILAALLAPVITAYWPWGALSTEPNHPGELLDPLNGNLPRIGPPNHGFIWQHPLGHRPLRRVGQPGPAALRSAHRPLHRLRRRPSSAS